jgi:transposase-like protein
MPSASLARDARRAFAAAEPAISSISALAHDQEPAGRIRQRYASKKYWRPLTRDLRLIYTAADQTAAAAALGAFAAAWDQRYPAIEKLWRAH